VAGAFCQPTPTFDVASVKLDVLPPGSFRFGNSSKFAPNVRISGNRIALNSNLAGIVAVAYNVQGFQISGAPRWTDSRGREDFYQVDARTPGEGVRPIEQVRQCLQGLLADRFQLKIHRETATLPVYNLVVARSGSKMKESEAEGEPHVSNVPGAGPSRQTFSRYSIDDLIRVIAGNVDRPVLDKTDLTGRYDFILEFTRSNPDLPDSGDDEHSIFSAVQRQLGLQLTRANEPTLMIVIDHAEKPSAN
jgi:uncharacterized protein (TIGR03435 family)